MGPRGLSPSLKGVQGWSVGQRGATCPAMLREGSWGSTWALAEQRHRAVVAPIHGHLPAGGSPPQQVTPRGSHTTGGQRGVSKPPWPHRSQERPHILPWCPWHKGCALQQPSTCHRQLLWPQGLGCAGNRQEVIRWQRGDTPGPAQEAPGALLARQGAEKRVCRHRYHGCSASYPQLNLHTSSQHRVTKNPVQRGRRRVPWMNPTALTATSEDRGCDRALARGCSHSSLPHTPAGLDTHYSRQGKPLPKSISQIHWKTDSLTGMQRTSGQARHTISVTGLCTRWTHRAQEGMTHRRSTVKSLEKLA